MGQNEIGNVLKKNYPKYLSFKEIMNETGRGKSSVLRCLMIMQRRDEVEYIDQEGRSNKSPRQKKYRIKEEK